MAFELDPETLRSTVDRARTHDPDAWEALYRHCYPRLISYARRRLHDHQAAEDAVSEAMARALRGIEGFTWQGVGFDGWMYGILRNVVNEQRRGHYRRVRLVGRHSSERATGDHDASTPSRAAERADEERALLEALSRLDDDERELLELRLVGELTAAEAGELLDKQPGAIRTAQMRALKRLRTFMKELGHDR